MKYCVRKAKKLLSWGTIKTKKELSLIIFRIKIEVDLPVQ